MMSLSGDKEPKITESFNSTSRYVDNLLNMIHFDGMTNLVYSSELQLNKATSSDTESPFLNLHLLISNGVNL